MPDNLLGSWIGRSGNGVRPRQNEQFREIFQGQQPTPPAPVDGAEEMAALMIKLTKLIQNTNFTAALPAYNEPQYWSQPIDVSNRVTVGTAASTAWTTLSSYKAATGRWARVSGYGINVLNNLYTYNGDLLFRLTLDGNPLPGGGPFGEQRGTIVQPRRTFVVLQQDQEIRLEVRRAVAGPTAYEVDGCLVGWNWRPLRPLDGPGVGIPY